MDLLEERTKSPGNDVLEKRFIGLILKEEAAELDNRQRQLMSSRGFTTSKFYGMRGFQVIDNNKLQYQHPIELRYIDMKKRETKKGSVKKKSHPVHNKPLFGMVNNMLKRLQFEFTDKMKAVLLTYVNK